MKLGIIGLPKTGKTTLFNALTGQDVQTSHFAGPSQQVNVGVAKLHDPRLDFIFELQAPKKKVPVSVEYVDVGGISARDDRSGLSEAFLNAIRPADGLILVLRNFEAPGLDPPAPASEAAHVLAELIVSDLDVVEKKLARMDAERHKGKKPDAVEKELLELAKGHLEKSAPLRALKDERFDLPQMRGYGFLSLKPILYVINQPDEGGERVDVSSLLEEATDAVEVRARLEMELMQLEEDEAIMFREEYGLRASVLDVVVERSFNLLDLITFYTVNEQEAHAWTVKKGTPALKAAGAVHSDFEKGFIRAEVVSFDDLQDAGSFKEAKDRGIYRLEGKEYKVADGDVVQFRFKV